MKVGEEEGRRWWWIRRLCLLPESSPDGLSDGDGHVAVYAACDQERRHLRSTVGAIAVTHVSTGKRVLALDTATIHFKAMPETVIETFVAGMAAGLFHVAV